MSRLVSFVVVAACLTGCHKHADKPAATGSAGQAAPVATPPAPVATPPAPVARQAAPVATPSAPVAGHISLHRIGVHAKLTVSGAVAGTADYTMKFELASCAEYAAKFELPTTATKLDTGVTTLLNDGPAHYHGPGTYGDADLQPYGSIDFNWNPEPHQPLEKDSTRTLIVNADGSGTYTFAKWVNPSSQVISGSLTWTCGS